MESMTRIEMFNYCWPPFVYLAGIKQFPKLIKIGMSRRPEQRMKDLSLEYGLNFYFLDGFVTEFYRNCERDSHAELKEFLFDGEITSRRSTGREIFEVNFSDALEVVRGSVIKWEMSND